MTLITGTHMGKLSPEALARRIIKNLRNRSRRGEERASGSRKVIETRLYLEGNRRKRGL